MIENYVTVFAFIIYADAIEYECHSAYECQKCLVNVQFFDVIIVIIIIIIFIITIIIIIYLFFFTLANI